MDTQKIERDAHKLAANAKPGFKRLNDKLYTFVFDQKEWVYRVYEDGFLYLSFNTKSLTTAKKWLEQHVNN